MAKMDTLESVPFILRKTDRFLLPVSRNEYAILKGKDTIFLRILRINL